MSEPLRTLAVRWVKPVVPATSWRRLRVWGSRVTRTRTPPAKPLSRAEERRRRVSEVASQSGFALSVIDAQGPQAYQDAFKAMEAAGAQALAIGASPQFARDGARLAKLAMERNLPTILRHPSTPFVIAWAVIRGLGAGLLRLANPARGR